MRSPISNAHRPGFTLVEILVVVVILGIAAAMVVPHMSALGDMQASSAARVVLTDLQYAQNESVVTQRPVTVTFDTDAHGYALSNADGALEHPLTKAAFQRLFPQMADFGQVRLTTADFGGASQVTFDTLGSPNRGGSVTVVANGYSYRVSLAPVTGRVTVESLNP